MEHRNKPAYRVSGTAEHTEYQRLTGEILHCRDLDRAGEISCRLETLRNVSIRVKVETVGDMCIGDVRYTVPWAFRKDGTVDARYPVEQKPSGTVSMRVVRREDGFMVG